MGGIALRKCANQRAHPVWIGERKRGMGSQARVPFRACPAAELSPAAKTICPRRGHPKHSAHRNRPRLAGVPACSCRHRVASAAMRSVILSAVVILPVGARNIRGFACCRQKIDGDIAQGAASGAFRVRRIAAGHLHSIVSRGERRAEPLADRSCETPTGREKSSRDRSRGRFRGRCRLHRAGPVQAQRKQVPVQGPRQCLRKRRSVDRRRASLDPSARPATLSISRRIEIVCMACQRLNGSLSCAARKARSSARKVVDELDRRRKSPIDRKHGTFIHLGELKRCAHSAQNHHFVADRFTGQRLKWYIASVRCQQDQATAE